MNIAVPNNEKKENIETSTTDLPQIKEVEPTSKPKPSEDKTTITNVPEPTKLDKEVSVQSTEKVTSEHKVDINFTLIMLKPSH